MTKFVRSSRNEFVIESQNKKCFMLTRATESLALISLFKVAKRL